MCVRPGSPVAAESYACGLAGLSVFPNSETKDNPVKPLARRAAGNTPNKNLAQARKQHTRYMIHSPGQAHEAIETKRGQKSF